MAGHHMPASAGRPAAGEQGEAAHRRYTSSGTGRHDVRTGLHGRHASSAHCGGGGDHMDTSTFQRPGPGQQHPRVPGGELEGRRDQHAADTSSYTSRASRSGASADRGESSARRGRVNESWIPPPSGRSIQLHGWPGRTALIILALGLALLAPGAGAQQCQTTGPEGFTVVCSASGAYVEISGGSSWRRCIKKICAPYPQSPGTLVKGLAGADPASLFYGETVSVECVSEAGVFYTPRGTGSNTSTCLGDCSFTATTQCVLATTCAVNVTAHGVGEALFLVEGSALAFGVVPQEVRRSVVAPLGGRIFNQEPLRTTCQAGFRSSTSTHASGGACALTHSATCQPTGLLSPTTQTCQAVRCPAHQEICEYEPCGADQNTPVGVPTPTSLLSFNEMVTVDCNKGYFFTPNGSYAPSCTQLGGDNFYDVFPKLGQLTCGPVCQTPKNGRRCEPLPCPCITPPPNAFVLRNDIRYWETVNVTCDPGFALSTTTAEECSKDAPVTCSLNSTSTGVGVYPTLPDTQCAPAPCGAFPHPASSSVRNSTGAAGVDATYIHGDVLRVTCDAGRRGVYGDAGWASCANVTGFGVACSECAFNVSYACARVLCPLPDLSSMFSAWLNSTTRAALVAGGGAGGGGERGDDPLYGDSITYACIEGYRVESYNVTSLAEVEVACDAECGLATPTCLPVQCPAVTVANSVVVTYSWEASTDGHTRALGSSSAQMLFEDSVTFRCDAGFIAAAPGESGIAACVDELTMTCNSSAVLAGGEATCVAMACNVSDLAFVGSASVLIVALGSDTTVTCEDGYRAVPLDEDFATCTAPDAYTARCAGCTFTSTHKCAPVQCNTTGLLPRHSGTLSITPDAELVTFGASVSVRCAPGFRAQDDDPDALYTASVSCLATCALEAALTCSRVRCNMTEFPPDDTEFLTASYDRQLFFSDQAILQCSPGFTPTAAGVEGACSADVLIAECKGTGLVEFAAGNGTCRPVSCPAPFDQYATVDVASNVSSYGAVANVTCAAGYRASPFGMAFASCGDSGRGAAYFPSCSANCLFGNDVQCLPVTCNMSTLRVGLNGVFGAFNESALFGFQERVNVTCDAGFRYASADRGAPRGGILTCTESCGFDVACQNVQCNTSHLPPGNATAASTLLAFYRDALRINCDAGYVVASGSTTDPLQSSTWYMAACGADGDMDRRDEGCAMSQCRVAQLLYTNWSSTAPISYGDVAVRCAAGAKATAGNASLCADPGGYEASCAAHVISAVGGGGGGVACRPTFCDAGALNASLAYGGKGRVASGGLVPLGGVVDVQCSDGFRFGGRNENASSGVLECRCDGAFEGVVCAGFQCEVRHPFASVDTGSGLVSRVSAAFGESLLIQCDAGYIVASGGNTAGDFTTSYISVCDPDGLMTRQAESCVVSTCPAVSDTLMDRQDPEGISSYMQSVNATCVESSRAVSSPGGVPSRAATCGDPAWYNGTCHDFTVEIENNMSCTQITCPLQPLRDLIGTTGSVSSPAGGGSALIYGETVNVTCGDGARFGTSDAAGPRSALVACGCAFLAAACVPVECDVVGQTPANSNQSNTSSLLASATYGQEVGFACYPGYMHASNASFCQASFAATCADSGLMVATTGDFLCMSLGCEVSTLDLTGATASASGEVTHEHEILIACNAGYRADSFLPSAARDGTTMCNTECSFDAAPVCQRLQCDVDMLVPDDATLVYTTYPGYDASSNRLEYQTNLPITCNAGYWDAAGARCTFALGCDAEGGVPGADVNCSAYQCDTFSDANSASADSGFLNYGVTHSVTCAAGHTAAPWEEEAWCTMPGGYNVTCGDSCRGYTQSVRCHPVSVNFTVALDYFTARPDTGVLTVAANPQYQDAVSVSCSAGYRAGNQDVDGIRVRNDTVGSACAMTSTNVEDFMCLPVKCNASDLNSSWTTAANAHWADAETDTNDFDHPSLFQCDDGFLLSSSTNAQCERGISVGCGDDGALIGTAQRCVPLVCTPDVADAYALSVSPPSATSANETSNVTCMEGYRVSVTETSEMSDATWYTTACDAWDRCSLSLPPAHCKPVRCAVPSPTWLAPPPSALRFGTPLTLACAPGYKLNSSLPGQCVTSFPVGCASNSSVTGFTEVCILTSCGPLDEPFAAPLLVESVGNTSYTVPCAAGYRAAPLANPATTCDGNYSYDVFCGGCVWDAPLRQCSPVTCAVFDPAVFQSSGGINAGVNMHNASMSRFDSLGGMVFPAAMTVDCAHGYRSQLTTRLNVTAEATCAGNMSLTATCGAGCGVVADSRCAILRCDTVDNASTTVAGAIHGDSATVSCKPGYRAAASPPATPATPTTCGMDATFEAVCDDCGADTGGLGCMPIACDLAPIAAQPRVALLPGVASVLLGENVTIVCAAGFRPFSDNVSMPGSYAALCGTACVLELPTQEAVCRPIRSIEKLVVPDNAHIQNRSNPTAARYIYFGDVVSLSCDPGFATANSSCETLWEAYVTEDGVLVRGEETCVAFTCPPYTYDPNTAAVAPNTSVPYLGTVAVSCLPNHRVSSLFEASLRQPAAYTARCDSPRACDYSSSPTCKPLECVCPPVDAATLTVAVGVKYGEDSLASCRPGYRVGPGPHTCDANTPKAFTATCVNDGCAFSLNAKVCEAVKCDLAPTRAQAAVATVTPSSDFVLFGASADVTCIPGFRPLSQEQSAPSVLRTTCNASCMLAAATPVCRPMLSEERYAAPAHAAITTLNGDGPDASNVEGDDASACDGAVTLLADIRLVACRPRAAGSDACCCRVEIKHESAWGTVCGDSSDDSFHAGNAAVACRQAGRTAGPGVQNFGGGNGLPIWLDNLACTGDETTLGDCVHSDWGVHTCEHSEDAGVCCGDLPPPAAPSTSAPAGFAARRVAVGDVLEVTCDVGFRVAGAASGLDGPGLFCARTFLVSLNASGFLAGGAAACVPVQCSPNGFHVEKGAFNDSGLVEFSAAARVSCAERHRATTAGRVDCSAEKFFDVQCGPDCTLVDESVACVFCDPSPCVPYLAPQGDLALGRGAGRLVGYPAEQTVVNPPFVSITIECDTGFIAASATAARGELATGFSVACDDDGFTGGRDTCVCPPGSIVSKQFDLSGGAEYFCVCDVGTYGTISEGPLECMPCPSGASSPVGSTTIEQCRCVAGLYGEDAVTGCYACPANSYSQMGSVSVSQCRCVVNTYRGGDGTCVHCPANSLSAVDSSGIDACLCVAGFHGINASGLCTPCPAYGTATLSEQFTLLTPEAVTRRQCYCTAGYFGRGTSGEPGYGLDCTTCGADATSEDRADGPGECWCAAGTYRMDDFFTDAFRCASCPADASAPERSTDILDCNCIAGSYFDSASERCAACGEYKEFTTSEDGADGAAACFCDATYYSRDGVCIKCAKFAISPAEGSGGDCYCGPGTYEVDLPSGPTCVQCPADTYWTRISGTVACKPCAADAVSLPGSISIDRCECAAGFSQPSFCEGSGSERVCGPCVPCPSATYKPTTANQAQCDACPANSGHSLEGARNVTACICNAGYGVLPGPGSACAECTAGEYQTPQRTCAACDSSSTSTPRATACQCKAGFTPGASNGFLCSPCAAGKYKAAIGGAACTPCASGTSSNQAATKCTCGPGLDGSGLFCTPCAAGTYKSFAGDLVCVPCPGHMTSPAGATAEAQCECTPGFTYNSDAEDLKGRRLLALGVCEACLQGFFKPGAGPQACTACPRFAYSPFGSTSPLACACPAGSSGPPGATACVFCAAGTYKSVTGNATCLSCPPGTTSFPNATRFTDCFCGRGFGRVGAGACFPCGENTFKNASGNAECAECSQEVCPVGGYRSACTSLGDSTCSKTCTNAPADAEYIAGGVPYNADNCDYQLLCTPPAEGIKIGGKTTECACGRGWTGEVGRCAQCAKGLIKNTVGATPCLACAAGKYSMNPAPGADQNVGGSVCLPCRPFSSSARISGEDGCYCNEGYENVGADCSMCRPGFVKAAWGAVGCVPCPARTFTTRLGTKLCDGCPEFSVTGFNYTFCVCEAGYTGTAGACTACAAGKYKTASGPQECVVCPQGTYMGTVGASVCTPCAVGAYQDLLGQAGCKSCPGGASTTVEGAVAKVQCTCVKGYRAPNRTTYPSDDDWCARVCPLTAAVVNGSFFTLTPNPIFEDKGNVVCLEGKYSARIPELLTQPMTSCSVISATVACTRQGTWVTPLCKPMTCRFTPFANSRPDVSMTVGHKTVVTVACNAGFLSTDAAALMPVCGDTCAMSNYTARCKGVACSPYPELATVLPATLVQRSAAFSEAVQLTCKERHIVSSVYPDAAFTACRKSFAPTCQLDKTFSMGVEPCVPATCRALFSELEGVKVTASASSATASGELIPVECKAGFTITRNPDAMLTPASSVQCSGLTTFEATCGITDTTGAACQWWLPCICQRTTCGALVRTAHSSIRLDPGPGDSGAYVFEDSITLVCNTGYKVEKTPCANEFQAVCGSAGSWVQPKCIPLTCVDVYTIEKRGAQMDNGAVKIAVARPVTAFGNSTAVQCAVGFVAAPGTPSTTRSTCSQTCILEPLPKCEPLSCTPYLPLAQTLPNLVLPSDILSPRLFGDTVAFSCDLGHYMDSSITLAGLESLGAVTILSFIVFGVPDPTRQVVYAMSGDYAATTLGFPAASFPTAATEGPSAAVFTLSTRRSSATSRREIGPAVQEVVGPYLNLGPATTTLRAPITISLTFDASRDYGNLEVAGAQMNMTDRSWILLKYALRAAGPVDYETGVVYCVTRSFDGPMAAVSFRPGPGAPDIEPDVVVAGELKKDVVVPDIEVWAKVLIIVGTLAFFCGCTGVYLFCCASYSEFRLYGIERKHHGENEAHALIVENVEEGLAVKPVDHMYRGGTSTLMERQAVITKHHQDFHELLDPDTAHEMVIDNRPEATAEQKAEIRAEKRRLHADKKERNAVRNARKLGVAPAKMEGESSYLNADLIFADEREERGKASGQSIMKAARVPKEPKAGEPPVAMGITAGRSSSAANSGDGEIAVVGSARDEEDQASITSAGHSGAAPRGTVSIGETPQVRLIPRRESHSEGDGAFSPRSPSREGSEEDAPTSKAWFGLEGSQEHAPASKGWFGFGL